VIERAARSLDRGPADLPGRGHTPGSIALRLPEFGTLITGDTIGHTPTGKVVLGPLNADPTQAIETFHTPAAQDIDITLLRPPQPTDQRRDHPPPRGRHRLLLRRPLQKLALLTCVKLPVSL
jgi:hypothetical protein